MSSASEDGDSSEGGEGGEASIDMDLSDDQGQGNDVGKEGTGKSGERE